VVLHPDARYNAPFVEEWLDRSERYLTAGYTVYFMMHCPNNQHCPAFAEAFHDALRHRMGDAIGSLPSWPLPQQETLF
jgi:uncharacterized protein YecE (DUF72 family)